MRIAKAPSARRGRFATQFSDASRLCLAFLEAADQVGYVGRLLLQIALVFLETLKQRLRVGEASASAAATVSVVSASVHVFHLLSS
jgi:hypothetical protein